MDISLASSGERFDIPELKKKFDKIKKEIELLKEQNKSLKEENTRLKEQLDHIQRGQQDIFQTMSEKERLAMRQQILGLIDKIDSHLGNK